MGIAACKIRAFGIGDIYSFIFKVNGKRELGFCIHVVTIVVLCKIETGKNVSLIHRVIWMFL